MDASWQPSKLVDCLEPGADRDAELFIVEGDSASLAVVNARSARYQAVLPMRGKPLNAWRASRARVLQYDLYRELIAAVGAGLEPDLDIARVRYQRILILTDPDADGIHCGALLLMFFHRWMPALLAAGRVFAVRAPIGAIYRARGETPVLAYTDAHFQALCHALRERGELDFTTVRYRGLGSIDRDVLQTTCIEPATRRSQLLSAQDAEMALSVFAAGRPPHNS
jgi:DNA gyrase subunit B/topoisomerase-4 subunit B